ncbi:MAG: site-2 protease family protein, partial [Candidatus Pacebacteria bacterium]|nr:site-2 protease family protein [Candidatus Paceibacterota bacterium]
FFRGIMTGGADFEAVAGPIGIVGVVGDAAQLGIVSVMILTAVISINLGLINLFPFPALDGGRLLFLGIEAVRKKSIKPQVANTVNSIGFFLLLLLMAIITYYDIVDLF